jgi:pimeloyl-ACP methyl ester carboxylesterase
VAPPRERRRRKPLTTAALVLTAVTALPAGCSSSTSPPGAGGPARTAAGAAGPSGESKPVYSYKKAVRETVWVDTGLDEDGDGKHDRVAVDIVRPGEPAAKGRKIPVIMEASPYYSCCGRGNESQKKTYDAGGQQVRFPLFYDNYFVPRGYAFVAVDLPGTGRSDGCTDAGGPIDIQSAKSVIDWLNGRTHGYTSHTGTTRAQATWTDGATGMIGKSWDGSIANGVAATGVEGLKTIVPISSISSWYDAYFSQGTWLVGSAPTPGALIRTVESDAAGRRCAAVDKPLGDPAAVRRRVQPESLRRPADSRRPGRGAGVLRPDRGRNSPCRRTPAGPDRRLVRAGGQLTGADAHRGSGRGRVCGAHRLCVPQQPLRDPDPADHRDPGHRHCHAQRHATTVNPSINGNLRRPRRQVTQRIHRIRRARKRPDDTCPTPDRTGWGRISGPSVRGNRRVRRQRAAGEFSGP